MKKSNEIVVASVASCGHWETETRGSVTTARFPSESSCAGGCPVCHAVLLLLELQKQKQVRGAQVPQRQNQGLRKKRAHQTTKSQV